MIFENVCKSIVVSAVLFVTSITGQAEEDPFVVMIGTPASGKSVHSELVSKVNDDSLNSLIAAHETASFETFRFGVSDRGASIRIPIYTVEHNWKGYLEDRRPASNADPYRITARIVETAREAHNKALES